MADISRRWLVPALLVATGGGGALLAFGVNQGLEGYLQLPEDAAMVDLSGSAVEPVGEDAGTDAPTPDQGEDAPDREVSDGPVALTREDWVDPVVRRNIFDSSKVGQPGAATDGPVDPSEGRRTDLKVVLLATVVAIPETYSSALIVEEKGLANGYGINDVLMGEATIVRIEQKKVYIRRNDGALEYLDMEGNREVPERGAGSLAKTDGEEENGVTKSGDNKFVVERSLVDQALSNPEALASQVRVVPHKTPDGEIDGYRLSGVRKGSLFEKLGIKNGDVVHAVNGKELTSTSAALDAYNSLQSSSSFSFDVTRRGKRQTMDYEIR